MNKKLKLSAKVSYLSMFISNLIPNSTNAGDTTPLVLEIDSDSMYAKSHNSDNSFVRRSSISLSDLCATKPKVDEKVMIPIVHLTRISNIVGIMSGRNLSDVDVVITYAKEHNQAKYDDDSPNMLNVAKKIQFSSGPMKFNIPCGDMMIMTFMDDHIWDRVYDTTGFSIRFEMPPEYVKYLIKISKIDTDRFIKIEFNGSDLVFSSYTDNLYRIEFEAGNVVIGDGAEPFEVQVSTQLFLDILAKNNSVITDCYIMVERQMIISDQQNDVLITGI